MADSTDIIEWRAVPRFPDYEVSDDGQVRVIGRFVTQRLRGGTIRDMWRPARILKPVPKIQRGRPIAYTVRPRERGKRRNVFYVHRLILEAFVGPCPVGMEGCHGDGDCANNRLENLRWDTRKSNVADAKRHGTHRGVSEFLHLRDYSKTNFSRGELHGRAKLTEESVREIRRLSPEFGQRVLARKFGVSKSTIANVLRRRIWKHI